jgi:amino acid permease
MYSQFYLNKSLQFDEKAKNFQKCILGGNWLMLVSFLIVTLSIVMTFGANEHFSIAMQVAGHIATIISAGLLKLGYVLRCVGVHGLGYKVF